MLAPPRILAFQSAHLRQRELEAEVALLKSKSLKGHEQVFLAPPVSYISGQRVFCLWPGAREGTAQRSGCGYCQVMEGKSSSIVTSPHCRTHIPGLHGPHPDRIYVDENSPSERADKIELIKDEVPCDCNLSAPCLPTRAMPKGLSGAFGSNQVCQVCARWQIHRKL